MTGRTSSGGGYFFVVLAGVAAMLSPSARAVVLLPGETGVPTGTTYSTTVVEQVDRLVTLTDGTNNYGDITVRDTVTRNADGTLNFEFQLINTSPQAIQSDYEVRVHGLDVWQTDVGYDSASTGVGFPQWADRDVLGDDIGFVSWTSALAVGEKSQTVVIRTNARAYGLTGLLSPRITINRNMTFPTDYLLVFGPTVPEPATLALLAMIVPVMLLRRQASKA